ncbi:MAG: MFS transporter [Nitrospirae bacterium]|nr:MFS transporter [Nitrospirota bacterium]
MKFNTFSALRHRNFRLFFIGQSVSLIGTWMHSLAQGWLVLKLTDSAFYLSLVQAMGSLPILFLSLIGGVVADRVVKRNLLLVTQALSMALATLLAVLVGMGAVTVWHVIVIATILGVVNTFDIPGRQSFIVEMVGKEDLMNGIALNSAIFNGARIIGPAIGGVLIAAAGITACFYINAASYAAIIAGLLMMRFEAAPPRRETHPMMKELKEGLAYVRHTPSLLYFILMVSITSLLAIPYIALMPVFARDVLGVGARGLGIMMGSAGAGALGGALTLATIGSVRRKGLTTFSAAFISSAALLLFSFSRSYPLSCALLVVVGWGMITQLATVNTLIQTDVPDDLRGRVMSLYTLVFLGFIPVGNLIVGTMAHYLGTPRAVAVSASACLVIFTVIVGIKKDLLSY